MQAADLFEQGMRQSKVAEALGATPQAVSLWRRAWSEGGREALLSKGPGGNEGPRVFRTGVWPFISRDDSQPLMLGVDFAWRAITNRRVKAFVIVPEFDVPGDVLSGGFASEVCHARYPFVL